MAVLTGFAFESLGSVVGPFLLKNGYEKSEVGAVLSATVVAMIAGALSGGKGSDRVGARTVFLISGLVLCVSVSALGLMHGSGMRSWIFWGVLLSYFFIGTFTASSYSFFMANSKGEMEATRFTFLMAMTNLCESLAAFSVGKIISASKYSFASGFLFAAALSFVGLIVLWKCFKNQNPRIEKAH